uniref:Phosphatidylinositol-glycan biosynthesis class X protein n=1 Tax=Culicoides sonorensis TaxID=179676 RepID=A0A336LUD1_CULSO
MIQITLGLILGLIQFISSEPQYSTSLDFFIKHAGFHRELQYRLGFGGFMRQSCEFILVQNLPAAVFVNTDQLNDLKRLKKIETYVPVYMDVEVPAIKSFHFQMYIFGDIKKAVNISLPIHFRYQQPTDMKFVRVEIHSPTIYFRCESESSPELKPSKGQKEEEFPCRTSSNITDYDRIKEIDVCLWEELEFINDPTTLSVLIPAGNIYSYKFVLPITIVISWLGCFYIVYIVLKKTKNLNKKIL